VTRATLLLPVLLLASACTRDDAGRSAAELETLRGVVSALADSARLVFGDDSAVPDGDEDAHTIAVGVRVATLREIVATAAAHYLDDVRLHVRPNAVVRTGDDVRVRIGPATITAGRWDLAVTVQRVDATLGAGDIEIVAADSNRIDLVVPVLVSDATGRALIDFSWNARRVTSVVCSDFAVREAFTGYVEPHTQRVRGHFVVTAEEGHMIARPVLRDRIFVSPRPTEQSWERVREILREQNHIFRCGLAISPDRMEEMLRELLTSGFRFSLPASILRPIALPGSLLNEVEVAGRRVAVEVTPRPPRITAERLWLRADVRPRALDDVPIRIDGS
jgi:hypothetical protein